MSGGGRGVGAYVNVVNCEAFGAFFPVAICEHVDTTTRSHLRMFLAGHTVETHDCGTFLSASA